MKNHSLFRYFFVFGILLAFSGCSDGPNTASVSGVVQIDGLAVESVHVQFVPKSGERSSIGYTDAKGYYYLRFTEDQAGCIPGDHQVRITAYSDPSNEMSQYLPAEYNTKAADNPEMNVTVKKGRQKFDFQVTTSQ